MGFAISYRSTRPVSPAKFDAVDQAAGELCRDRSWLSCEPVLFFPGQNDGHLFGASKPNFQPHPDDAAAAAQSGLPDGTPGDLLAILCQLSRDHDVHWEISHDFSDGPLGYIRHGQCDENVTAQIEAFADLGDVLADFQPDFDSAPDDDFPAEPRQRQHPREDDEDGPSILPFKPKGK